jgi:hypothetical protein
MMPVMAITTFLPIEVLQIVITSLAFTDGPLSCPVHAWCPLSPTDYVADMRSPTTQVTF